MRIIIVICIYNRLPNLHRWINAWGKSQQLGAELIVVHNQDNIQPNEYQGLCQLHGVTYIARQNVGFETGIIQDVFLNKLRIKKWDYMLFVTDDTIPVKKDFLLQYVNELKKPDIGCVCMEISGVWTPHIRTTGFMVSRETATKIYWVNVPIANKEECYFFEHQGFQDTMMSQILNMGKRVVQLSNIATSALWDSDHHADHKRLNEYNKQFK